MVTVLLVLSGWPPIHCLLNDFLMTSLQLPALTYNVQQSIIIIIIIVTICIAPLGPKIQRCLMQHRTEFE